MSFEFSLRNLFRPQHNTQVRQTRPLNPRQGDAPQTRSRPTEPLEPQRPNDGSTARSFASSEQSGTQVTFGAPSSDPITFATPSVARLNSGGYRADSASAMQGSVRGMFTAGESPFAVSNTEDAGKSLKPASDSQANRALQSRLAAMGVAPEALQKLAALRDAMPSNAEKKELNAYIKALAENPDINESQILNVLNKATDMMSNTYNNGLPNHEVMLSALHDVAVPENISQEEVGTCAACSAQMQMAIADPVAYMGTVDSLAAGESVQVGGQTLEPNYTFLEETGSHRYRTPSSALMQNAIMDTIDGAREYSSAYINIEGMSDQELRRQGIAKSRNRPGYGIMGTAGDQAMTNLSQLLTDFTGRSVQHERTASASGEVNQSRNAALLNRLAAGGVSPQNPALVYMNWSQSNSGTHGIHAVNIVGIENGQVTIMNPWGREETFSLAEMQNRLRGAIV